MVDAGDAMAQFAQAVNVIGAWAGDDSYRAMCTGTTAQERARVLGAAIEEAASGCRAFAEHSEVGNDVFGRALSLLDEMRTALRNGSSEGHLRRLAERIVDVFRPAASGPEGVEEPP
jgi:hypothetical protein